MTATALSPLTGAWRGDPVHSTVAFEVEHLGVSTFRGRFRDFDATVAAGDEGLRITGAARVDSLDIDDPQLRGHLLAPDFFDAERTPEIRFESSDVRVDGDQIVAAGGLTIRGETRPVEAHGRVGEVGVDPVGNKRVGLELTATVDRRDFGIDLSMELPNGKPMIGSEVRLLVRLELVRDE